MARLREAVQRLRDGSGAAAAEQGRLLEGMHGQHLLLLDYHSKARAGRGAACVRACEGRKGGGVAEEGGTSVSGCGWGGRWKRGSRGRRQPGRELSLPALCCLPCRVTADLLSFAGTVPGRAAQSAECTR